jgi:hypothetical protein
LWSEHDEIPSSFHPLARPAQLRGALQTERTETDHMTASLAKHSAPGSNAGFNYQFERALLRLAESTAGFVVGIETDDDVVVRSSTGELTLEQGKHSIQQDSKPFGNRSKDLWNTLATWTEALKNGEVSADATEFFMVTNKAISNCIACDISKADSDAECDACIVALEAAGKNPSAKIAKLVKGVLDRESRTHLRALIQKCKLVDARSASGGTLLRKKTIDNLRLPEWCLPTAESIVNELLGWLHTVTLGSWNENKPAWITQIQFANQLHAILERRRREIKRERSEHLIPIKDEAVGKERARPFVKQLHLVTEDDELVDGSIRDYVRCKIEKLRLSQEGNITDEDWVAFETALIARWQKISASVQRTQSNRSSEDIGFAILTETTLDHCAKLAGSDTEQVYLTSGSYHRLADSLHVGWHPKFKELMQKLFSVP